MIDVSVAFLTVALIIIAGYFGVMFFKKTKIPELILLMVLGLLIGPIATALGFNFIGPGELAIFQEFLPFFAAFALIMILFEGGMQLNFFNTIKSITQSLAFTVGVFILGMIFIVGALWFVGLTGLLPFDPLLAMLIAAIIGGTSSAVIIPLVASTSAREETKTLLSLESALTDALCIITAVAIGEIILLGSVSFIQVSSSITANFAIAVVLGFILGLFWLKAMSVLQGKSYEYLMTLAMLLLTYSGIQLLGGNGAIGVLIFGLVLGNGTDITKMLRIEERMLDKNIKNFHSELSFLVKTFFFVYLGILFKLEYATAPVILIAVILMALIIFSRYIVSGVLAKVKPVFAFDQKLLTTMSARGLAAAVLVSLPISMGLNNIANSPFTNEVINQITAIVFLVILFSNVVTTIGVFTNERKGKVVTKSDKDEMAKDIKEEVADEKKPAPKNEDKVVRETLTKKR